MGKALDFSAEESMEIATYLQDMKWAVITQPDRKLRLRLTPLSYEEIRLLRQATWRRWISEHPLSHLGQLDLHADLPSRRPVRRKLAGQLWTWMTQ
jgi:hypothetical protein